VTVLRVRTLPKQILLPACRDGADFGVPQLLLGTIIESGRRLIWWPGHKAWSSRGESKWYPGELFVDAPNDRTYPCTRLELPRTPLRRIFQSDAAQKFVRTSFTDEEAAVLALDPSKTIEVRYTGRCRR
jgi:hypothetical protein